METCTLDTEFQVLWDIQVKCPIGNWRLVIWVSERTDSLRAEIGSHEISERGKGEALRPERLQCP